MAIILLVQAFFLILNFSTDNTNLKSIRFIFRPYFTYWLSFVQVTILIVMISVYSFAPIGVSQMKTEQNVSIEMFSFEMFFLTIFLKMCMGSFKLVYLGVVYMKKGLANQSWLTYQAGFFIM